MVMHYLYPSTVEYLREFIRFAQAMGKQSMRLDQCMKKPDAPPMRASDGKQVLPQTLWSRYRSMKMLGQLLPQQEQTMVTDRFFAAKCLLWHKS